MQSHNKRKQFLPALRPEEAALFKPFFFTIKLDPIKKLEDKANTNPLMLSEGIPFSDSTMALTSRHPETTNNISLQKAPVPPFPFHNPILPPYWIYNHYTVGLPSYVSM